MWCHVLLQVSLGNKSCPYFWSPSSQVSEIALYKEKEDRFGCLEDKLPFIEEVSTEPGQEHGKEESGLLVCYESSGSCYST